MIPCVRDRCGWLKAGERLNTGYAWPSCVRMVVHRDDSVQTALMRHNRSIYDQLCGEEREMACEACRVEGMLSVLREPSLVRIESLRTSQKSDSSAKIISLVSYSPS